LLLTTDYKQKKDKIKQSEVIILPSFQNKREVNSSCYLELDKEYVLFASTFDPGNLLIIILSIITIFIIIDEEGKYNLIIYSEEGIIVFDIYNSKVFTNNL
jgi:hypothetical protein